MSFEVIKITQGQPRVRCKCDGCGREEVVCAVTAKGAGVARQAVPKLQKLGWSYVSKKLRCSTCEASRRIGELVDKNEPAAPLRQPTRVQKREIMKLLGDVYDEGAERYSGAETDDSVAEVLGVMPGWVVQIREEFFGPDGRNSDMDALAAEISKFMRDAKARIDAAKSEVASLTSAIDRVASMQKTLDQIKIAVGPRNLARVK